MYNATGALGFFQKVRNGPLDPRNEVPRSKFVESAGAGQASTSRCGQLFRKLLFTLKLHNSSIELRNLAVKRRERIEEVLQWKSA